MIKIIYKYIIVFFILILSVSAKSGSDNFPLIARIADVYIEIPVPAKFRPIVFGNDWESAIERMPNENRLVVLFLAKDIIPGIRSSQRYWPDSPAMMNIQVTKSNQQLKVSSSNFNKLKENLREKVYRNGYYSTEGDNYFIFQKKTKQNNQIYSHYTSFINIRGLTIYLYLHIYGDNIQHEVFGDRESTINYLKQYINTLFNRNEKIKQEPKYNSYLYKVLSEGIIGALLGAIGALIISLGYMGLKTRRKNIEND